MNKGGAMIIHKGLENRWFELPLVEQLANVGTDLSRAFRWKKKGRLDMSQKAFERVLELLDFTIADPKNRKRLKEVVRSRELLIDHFMFDNEYNTTEESWEKYFLQFNYAAAILRGK